MSWFEAVEFCVRLTERERALGRISANQEYHLPTEEEWEHACRAGTTNTGASEADLARAGWYCGNSGGKTHPVGQKESNAFGLYDMHGNVGEWTSTSHGSHGSSRGGGWNMRFNHLWLVVGQDCGPHRLCERDDGLGFRVVLSENQHAKSGSEEIEMAKIPGKPYAFGKYEVTQKLYQSIMGDNPSRFKGERLPVENVSWDEAAIFCKRLTLRERAAGRIPATLEYRLPTEEEWEHACRAGTTTRCYTGDSEADLDRAGWYRENSGGKIHPVGQKESNAFGLYDMLGNVWEWTSDSHRSSFAIRGGDGGCDALNCRVSRWVSNSIYYSEWIGFRVVLAKIQRGAPPEE